MAKRSRRIASTQRDKQAISTAKYLKRIGVLSPKANLHSGRFISRGVLHKVREYSFAESKDYTTQKVTRKTAEKAKAKGFAVVRGNRVIIPKDARYRKALRAGEPAGVVPVRSGVIETVPLPLDTFGLRRLANDIAAGGDFPVAPGEQFAFQFFGHGSVRPFIDRADFVNKLQYYVSVLEKWKGRGNVPNSYDTEDGEEVAAIVAFRMNPGTFPFPTRTERERVRAQKRRAAGHKTGRPSRYKPRGDLLKATADRVRAKDRERKKLERQAARQGDLAKVNRDNETAKLRMRAMRQRLSGKKPKGK